jgi:hypothetical protein
MNDPYGTDDIDRPSGYKGTIQGGATERAIDEQRTALWLVKSIVDSVEGSLKNHFGADWPAGPPDWPRVLRRVSQMIEDATSGLEAPVLERRGLAMARAESATEAKS